MEKVEKTILLGSSGQIGSNLKKKLLLISKKVKCLSKKELNLEKLKIIKKKLDILKPNLIINAAAYTKVDDAENNKKRCYKINVLSTKEIANWSSKNNCLFVHYSTVYIFDGKNKKPWKENALPKPINYYGKSKLEAEKKIIKSKCNYLILRLNWIYNEKGVNFPKKIINKIKKSNKIYLVNNQIGTPNDAEFIGNVTIKIIKKIIINKKNPKILNLSARGKTNYYDFAKKIYKKMKKKYKNCILLPLNSEDYKNMIGKRNITKRPLNSVLDIKKLEKFINVKMPSWEDIFKKKVNKILK
tara:strand:+ start:965 stop:1864 length:900 start_codon:yes stop_codon:yes gene_type:complete